MSGDIQSVLNETRSFPPPADFTKQAHISSEAQYQQMWQQAKDDPAGFWGELAQNLHWFKKWDQVIQGETIVGDDKVDAGRRPPAVVLVEVAAAA